MIYLLVLTYKRAWQDLSAGIMKAGRYTIPIFKKDSSAALQIRRGAELEPRPFLSVSMWRKLLQIGPVYCRAINRGTRVGRANDYSLRSELSESPRPAHLSLGDPTQPHPRCLTLDSAVLTSVFFNLTSHSHDFNEPHMLTWREAQALRLTLVLIRHATASFVVDAFTSRLPVPPF